MRAAHEAELSELLRFWQHELRLRDWDIVCGIVRGRALGTDYGRVTFDEKRKEALIDIRDPRDAPKNPVREYDMEVALVHELLHCSLACFTGALQTHEDIVQEQTIHAHSLVLVRLRRLSKGCMKPV
jgi:hypothetical protein